MSPGRLASPRTKDAPVAAGAESPKARPNVLLISLEDCNPFFGCFGHHQVRTPNIDRLATGATVFTHAYAQAPVCNPSRASMIMGLRPGTTGVYGNFDEWRDKIPEQTGTLPERFGEAGYRTATIGKIVHQWDGYERPSPSGRARVQRMWQEHLPEPDHEQPRLEARRPAAPLPEEFRSWPGAAFLEQSLIWGATGLTAEEHADAKRARRAAALISEHARDAHERPLFLSVGLQSAHYPFRPPSPFADMYLPEQVTLPNYPSDDLQDVPVLYSPFNRGDALRTGDEEKKELIASYFACVAFVDYCVGILLDALDAAGLLDSTIICLVSDHGLHLGEHGLWRKETLFEESARVPLIISPAAHVAKRDDESAPEFRPGVADGLVELIDIYPTLCELASIPAPSDLDGSSLAPLMQNPERPWRKAIFTNVRRGTHNVTVRSDAWRYSEWGDSRRRELYDLENDPLEIRNLAYDPAYSDRRREMQRLLREGWRTALPG